MACFRDAALAEGALELSERASERVPVSVPGLPAGGQLAEANLYAVAELAAARAPRESSRRQYRSIFRRFADVLRDELGRPPLVADLTADTIAAYARHLAASGGRGGRPAALSTRRVHVTMLRALAGELGLDDVADTTRGPSHRVRAWSCRCRRYSMHSRLSHCASSTTNSHSRSASSPISCSERSNLVRAAGVSAGQLPIQPTRDVQHRRAAGELHPRPRDPQLIEHQARGERLARPGRPVQHPQRLGREHVQDRTATEQQRRRLHHPRADQTKMMLGAHRDHSSSQLGSSGSSSSRGRLTCSSRPSSRNVAPP